MDDGGGVSPVDASWNRRYDIRELEKDEGSEPNWAMMTGTGIVIGLLGIRMLWLSVTIGGGMILIGAIIFIGSTFASRWEEDENLLSDLDDPWQDLLEKQAVDDDREQRQAAMKMTIGEVVRAVNSSIMIRCRNCGTLNAEKASRCESCGGPL
jgi:hypothetical protein